MEAVLVSAVSLPVDAWTGGFGVISILTQIRSAEPTMGGSDGFSRFRVFGGDLGSLPAAGFVRFR